MLISYISENFKMMRWFVHLLVISFSFNVFPQNADIHILYAIQKQRDLNQYSFFNALSKSIYPVSLTLPLAYYTTAIISKNKEWEKKAVRTIISLSSTFLLTYGLKYLIQRPRPYESYTFIFPLQKEQTPSFPSGHSSIAFNIASNLALDFPKWYVLAPAFTYAALVGYSRMYFGVHYPSDVLMGALVGGVCTFISFKFQKHLNRRFYENISCSYDKYHY